MPFKPSIYAHTVLYKSVRQCPSFHPKLQYDEDKLIDCVSLCTCSLTVLHIKYSLSLSLFASFSFSKRTTHCLCCRLQHALLCLIGIFMPIKTLYLKIDNYDYVGREQRSCMKISCVLLMKWVQNIQFILTLSYSVGSGL